MREPSPTFCDETPTKGNYAKDFARLCNVAWRYRPMGRLGEVNRIIPAIYACIFYSTICSSELCELLIVHRSCNTSALTKSRSRWLEQRRHSKNDFNIINCTRMSCLSIQFCYNIVLFMLLFPLVYMFSAFMHSRFVEIQWTGSWYNESILPKWNQSTSGTTAHKGIPT